MNSLLQRLKSIISALDPKSSRITHTQNLDPESISRTLSLRLESRQQETLIHKL